jgi:hypothetical protein
MRPDLLDPLFPEMTSAERQEPTPIRRWVNGPNSGPERCSGYVFGLKTFNRPRPRRDHRRSRTRRVYWRSRPRVNTLALQDLPKVASGTRSIPESPNSASAGGLSPLPSLSGGQLTCPARSGRRGAAYNFWGVKAMPQQSLSSPQPFSHRPPTDRETGQGPTTRLRSADQHRSQRRDAPGVPRGASPAPRGQP